MNLPCITAAPSIALIGGKRRLVRPFTLGDFAFLLRAYADSEGIDADGGESVALGDALDEWVNGEGGFIFVWLALRRDWPGFTLDDALAMTLAWEQADRDNGTTTARDNHAVLWALASRRSQVAKPAEGEGTDVALQNWAMLAYRYHSDLSVPLHAMGDYTLDQLHLIASRGECGSGESDAGRQARIDAVQAQHQAHWTPERIAEWEARQEAKPATPPVATAPLTIEDELATRGYRIVPETEQEVTTDG